jgi:hypothetical protein
LIALSFAALPAFADGKKATPEPTAKPTAAATAEATKEETKATESATPVAKATAEPESKPSEAGHKSTGIAVALATLPGFAVHGLGHMYAGSWTKGLGLFVVGTAGGAIAYSQAMAGYDDVSKLGKDNNGEVPTDLSGAYSRIGPILVGTMAFLWTYFDDISGSAIAVGKYNERVDQAGGRTGLMLQPRGDGAQLALTKRF